jgi:plastocyanin
VATIDVGPPDPPREHTRRGLHRPVALVAAVGLVMLLGAGCSSGGGDGDGAESGTGAVTATTATDAGSGGHGAGPGECVSRTPGQLLSEVEAVVRFTPEQICPGYVTIAAGTRVTWVNQDDVAHEVRVTQGTDPVATELVEPGRSWQYQFDTPGVFTFVTDAIEAFRGTVEVQGAGATVAPDAVT